MKRKPLEEYIGEKFNHLTITGIDRERRKKEKSCNTYVFADCDCGICGRSYNLAKIKKGETKSCGHLKLKHDKSNKINKIDLYEDYGIIYTDNKNISKFYFDLDNLSDLQDKYWYEDDYGYLTNCTVINSKNNYVRFHRLIMKADKNEFVDHINRNKKDNRKSNLRICTHQQNDINKGIKKNNKSGVIGVHWDKSRNKWCSSITYNYKNIKRKRFDSFKEAVKHRLLLEIKYFKEYSTQLNLLPQYFSEEEINEIRKYADFQF